MVDLNLSVIDDRLIRLRIVQKNTFKSYRVVAIGTYGYGVKFGVS